MTTILNKIRRHGVSGGARRRPWGSLVLLGLITAACLLAFAFSPFMTTEGLPGVLKSLWIALGCRILLGVIAGWLWRLLRKVLKKDYLALPVTVTAPGNSFLSASTTSLR